MKMRSVPLPSGAGPEAALTSISVWSNVPNSGAPADVMKLPCPKEVRTSDDNCCIASQLTVASNARAVPVARTLPFHEPSVCLTNVTVCWRSGSVTLTLPSRDSMGPDLQPAMDRSRTNNRRTVLLLMAIPTLTAVYSSSVSVARYVGQVPDPPLPCSWPSCQCAGVPQRLEGGQVLWHLPAGHAELSSCYGSLARRPCRNVSFTLASAIRVRRRAE